MMSVSISEEPERRIAEAMRAQATGLGRPGFAGRTPEHLAEPAAPHPPQQSADRPNPLLAALSASRFALLLALLGGIVLGITLALVSLLAPGVLPPLG